MVDQLLRLHPFGRGREPSDVGEERREELARGPEGDVALPREDRIRELWGEVSLEARRPLQLAHLDIDRRLQVGVRASRDRRRRPPAARVVRLRLELRWPNSSRFGTSTRASNSPLRDRFERVIHLAHGADQRPRQDRAERQGAEQTQEREARDGDRQEPTVSCERVRLLDDQRLRVRDHQLERVLQLVGDRVLLVDMERERVIDLALSIQVGHEVARDGESVVRHRELIEEVGPVRDGVGPHPRDLVGELRLRRVELVEPHVVTRDERHRAIVALRGDVVDHVASLARLFVERGERLDLMVHTVEHADTHDAHREHQDRDHAEPCEQLDVHGRRQPRDPVHEGTQERRERPEIVGGERGRPSCPRAGRHGSPLIDRSPSRFAPILSLLRRSGQTNPARAG